MHQLYFPLFKRSRYSLTFGLLPILIFLGWNSLPSPTHQTSQTSGFSLNVTSSRKPSLLTLSHKTQIHAPHAPGASAIRACVTLDCDHLFTCVPHSTVSTTKSRQRRCLSCLFLKSNITPESGTAQVLSKYPSSE